MSRLFFNKEETGPVFCPVCSGVLAPCPSSTAAAWEAHPPTSRRSDGNMSRRIGGAAGEPVDGAASQPAGFNWKPDFNEPIGSLTGVTCFH